MARLENRLSALEASLNEGDDYTRPLTDAERAVRLAHMLNGPHTPQRAKVVEFLQRTGASASDLPPNMVFELDQIPGMTGISVKRRGAGDQVPSCTEACGRP